MSSLHETLNELFWFLIFFLETNLLFYEIKRLKNWPQQKKQSAEKQVSTSPMKMETVSLKTKQTLDDNFKKIQLQVHPSIVSFITPFEIINSRIMWHR